MRKLLLWLRVASWLCRITFRYVSGRPMNGRIYTDSSRHLFRRGTRALTPDKITSRWAMLPGWRRAVWRLLLFPGVPLYLCAYLAAPHTAQVAGGTLGAAGGVWGIFWTRRSVQDWRHRRTYVQPLHRTLTNVLGVAQDSPDKWLTVPTNFADENADPVRVNLPPDTRVSAEMKVAIREVVAQKLGLHGPIESWHTIGREPYATFKPAPRPPDKVSFAEVAEAFRQASEVAPVIGIGSRKTIVDMDLDGDSPHAAISAGPGAGKSVLIANLLIHGLHHGAGAVILDYKRASHKWAEGLPGVVIAKNIEDIHDWAVRLGDEAERRNRAADEPGGFGGHRIYVVVEEWNALSSKLQTYWDGIRDKSDPKKSPAVQALSDIAFMGRHVLMNLLGVAQMLTARTTGGPETRECFGTRCLGRYTANMWKMLAPEVWPMPKKSKTPGRWQVVKAGEAFETQVAMPLHKVDGLWLLVDEARAWCLSGVANPTDVLGPGNPPTQGIRPGTVSATPRLVGLREVVDEGLLPGRVISLADIRKRKQRDRSFPPAVGKNGQEDLFELAALVEWKLRTDAIRLVDTKEEVA